MSRRAGLKRRQFLAGMVAAAPAATLASAGGAMAQAAVPARAPSVPPVPPNENVLPPPIRLTESRSGSDFMVDVIKTLDIDYIASLPAATFRGLQESLLNYGMNTKPEFILCLHEECAVAMAHGYAKVARKPMACMVHGTVGLQHATMAIYNAYADRAPILVISGNMQNTAARRPNVEWNHAALDQNAMVRDFTKWDAQPTSLAGHRRKRWCRPMISRPPRRWPRCWSRSTPTCRKTRWKRPKKPQLRIPKLRRRAHPQGDDEAVREAAKLLVAAENPVIYANRYGRSERAPALADPTGRTAACAGDRRPGTDEFPEPPQIQSQQPARAGARPGRCPAGARTGGAVGPDQRRAGSDRPAISQAEPPRRSKDHPYRYRKPAGEIQLWRGSALCARRPADRRRCGSDHAVADRSGAARTDAGARGRACGARPEARSHGAASAGTGACRCGLWLGCLADFGGAHLHGAVGPAQGRRLDHADRNGVPLGLSASAVEHRQAASMDRRIGRAGRRLQRAGRAWAPRSPTRARGASRPRSSATAK